MPHLAQLNVGTLRYPIDHPNIQEFVENLDRINQLAERSLGFVWRLQDEAGSATSFQVFPDPMTIVNMSVWENANVLKQYVYLSDHAQIMRKRQQWFEKHDGAFMVLWWVPEGHRPTLAEAKQRLELLKKNGETAEAFTFRKIFAAPILT
ncbi:DUF3291 domain-containing protein [Tunicatimonas pelagia]|uniref:DUF3291 domain-containing protein n=1 Tax=Tunicatimonas pelagia TaxID=931531 RepID=UPI002666AFB1|nr:DUF3291 domain-containing protein [Tunicatimonas pelagia]WKN42863.1 DUF3291 domain-containing protein [Tunicatimonas pelagia]